MDQDGLPIVGTGIDYSKVKPLDQKRLLAFVNHYVTHTVQFLNHFSIVCEEKMSKIESQMNRIEITMSILEAKLSSIPGMDDIKLADGGTAAPATDTASSQPPPQSAATAAGAAPTSSAPPPPSDDQPAPPPSEPEPDVPKVSQDPRFIKFFKMLNMGVPPPAVKIKMSSEGVDPDLLDTPDAPAPPNDLIEGDDSSDSDSPFTDSD